MKRRLKRSYVSTLCFAFILVGSLPLMTRAEMIEEWVARYNGPTDGADSACGIAVDAAGNVYVTGTGEDDYATVKYDSDGNQLWVQRYNGPGNGEDRASAIAVDSLGNVYVTGMSYGSETGYDYATVKYDTNGNQLWVARYNGPGSGYYGASAIAADPAGNVYVTGQRVGSGTGSDYATVKYDTDGNELWVKRYNGPGNGSDEPSAIAVDASGNVYVTGISEGSGTDFDYATIKYDTNGNQLWVARYNGPGNDYDVASAIAVDTSGNVYVTGTSATVKYDTDGNQLWVAQHPANAIAIDASGNIYVTGTSESDYATVKYDTDGNELWVKRYNGPASGFDRASAIALDASGNVYVTGESYGSGTTSDYATIKYDTDGNQLWVKRYNGPGNGDDRATAIAVDAAGNIYVTGESGSWPEIDYATVKYDTNGNQLWVARYNGPGNGSDRATAVVVDAPGNVYVTGSSEGPGTDFDCATVKYDTNGNQLWVTRYDGPGNDDDGARAIAVDASGNVYVTGYSWSSGTGNDYATVKYDTNGNQLWVARYNGPGNDADYVHAIAVDTFGNVYVTGMSVGNGTGDDYATVKYDTHGNQLWVARYNGPGDDYDWARAIAVDASGNIYVTGTSEGGGAGYDYATVKYGEGLPAGWSMMSLPVRPEVPTVANIFPQAVVVYRYQKGAGYVRVKAGEELEVGMGYWILLDKPQPYVMGDTEITEYTISVEDGWYMIGGCSSPAQKVVTNGKIVVIYGYTQGVGYTRVPGSQLLERGKGYWILFSSTSEGAAFTASTSASQ